MIYWQLFLAFLQIGAFSFGGGYAAMPLIHAQVVEHYGWLSQNDFADLVTIAEMTPGPIAVNAATFVGSQIAGVPGALVSTLGVILPSCIFVTILAWLYTRYRKLSVMQGVLRSLRPAVVAMILTAGLTILVSTIFYSGEITFVPGAVDIRALVLFLAAFILLRLRKIGPIAVMVMCGLIELAYQLISQ